jgi:two-component system, NtrC family, nitrogen regulation response regulator GlnG
MAARILLVEDDEGVRTLVATALKKEGYQVFQAAGPTEAKRLWLDEGYAFDLLLTDVRLEEEDDGFMLADKLLSTHPNIPVIFISGDRDCFASPAVQRFGDSPFLRKPFDIKMMMSTIADVLAKSQT